MKASLDYDYGSCMLLIRYIIICIY
jgi:hypothetical protein